MAGHNFSDVRDKLDQGKYYGDIRNTGWHRDAIYEKFSEAEYERRYQLTRQAMAKRNLDCIIVAGSIHAMSMGQGLVWLTGHLDIRTAAHYVVVPLEGEPTLFCSMGGSHVEAVVTVQPPFPISYLRQAQATIRSLSLSKAWGGSEWLRSGTADGLY